MKRINRFKLTEPQDQNQTKLFSKPKNLLFRIILIYLCGLKTMSNNNCPIVFQNVFDLINLILVSPKICNKKTFHVLLEKNNGETSS